MGKNSYLEWAGFNVIHKFGDFEEEAFNDNSELSNDTISTSV